MAYTTNELVTNAYFSSGVLSREFEALSGSQFADGLNWVNDIITEKTVDQGMIPYESKFTFNGVVGQEEYVIPNLIEISTIVFFKQNVRYSLRYEKRNSYQGSARVESIKSLPFEWYFERQLGGGTLFIYFTPDQDYPFEIRGIFRLSEIAAGQDLLLTLDRFYVTYLRYALADRICAEYNYTTPPNIIRLLGKYESLIKNKSRPMDLRMQKISTLAGKKKLNWADINIGHGWLPN